MRTEHHRRHLRAALVVAVVAPLAAACGSSSKRSAPPTTPATTVPGPTATTIARGSGPVNVLYAGSLVNLMEKQIGPAFQTATGYNVVGFSGGSDALATQIKGKIHAGDVFISASPTVTKSLAGAAGGNWVSWYATFATSGLVLGYNPSSKFASDLKAKPWYQGITEPGILVGRTDPTTDPKGKLAVEALQQAAATNHLPALATAATSTANVFPEETLVGRLQAGQLDAGFFYTSEAKAAGIPTVPLTGTDLKATYTVTVLNNAPDPAGAAAFVEYLLGSTGQSTLSGDGFTLTSPPTIGGTASDVPSGIQQLIASAQN